MTMLTPKELKVYEYIKRFTEKKGYAPSYAEIQDAFQFKAISSVQQYLDQLVTKGYLKPTVGENKRRALEVVEQDTFQELEGIVSIPVEGRVAAGRLTEAVQNREYVDIPRALIKNNGDYFALRVKGDSMIEDCIMDGDLVIIKRTHEASNGQTVVALVENDATIKRFYKRKGRIELHPANPHYDIITLEDTSEFKILGVLSSVIRQCE